MYILTIQRKQKSWSFINDTVSYVGRYTSMPNPEGVISCKEHRLHETTPRAVI